MVLCCERTNNFYFKGAIDLPVVGQSSQDDSVMIDVVVDVLEIDSVGVADARGGKRCVWIVVVCCCELV